MDAFLLSTLIGNTLLLSPFVIQIKYMNREKMHNAKIVKCKKIEIYYVWMLRLIIKILSKISTFSI